MNQRNPHTIHRLSHHRKVENGIECIEQDEKYHRTNHIEIEVHHGRPPGAFIGAHRGQERRGTRADVLTHDHRHRIAKGDGPRTAEGLQDAHTGAGTLHHRGQQRTGQDAKEGIGQVGEQLEEPGLMLQRRHGGGHVVHADHQKAKANQNGADAFLLL